MKKTLFVCCALALALGAQAQWKPVGDKIKTPWSEQVNPANVLPEYPRPQLERGDWQNLNGEWEYAIKPVGDVEPATFWFLLLSNPLCLAYRKKLAKTANYGISVLFPFLQPGKIRTSC